MNPKEKKINLFFFTWLDIGLPEVGTRPVPGLCNEDVDLLLCLLLNLLDPEKSL